MEYLNSIFPSWPLNSRKNYQMIVIIFPLQGCHCSSDGLATFWHPVAIVYANKLRLDLQKSLGRQSRRFRYGVCRQHSNCQLPASNNQHQEHCYCARRHPASGLLRWLCNCFWLFEHIQRTPLYKNEVCIRNPFIYVMNEVSRVLRVGGLFLHRTPAYLKDECFMDPTHVNPIVESTIIYFAKA